MSNVAKLPTAAASYYTVHKRRNGWGVVLVTPIEGLPAIKTTLRVWSARAGAVTDAKATAARMLRPFKEGRA